VNGQGEWLVVTAVGPAAAAGARDTRSEELHSVHVSRVEELGREPDWGRGCISEVTFGGFAGGAGEPRKKERRL
jgi:hypothetical protein